MQKHHKSDNAQEWITAIIVEHYTLSVLQPFIYTASHWEPGGLGC